jgi:hypothetical protein
MHVNKPWVSKNNASGGKGKAKDSHKWPAKLFQIT